MSDCLLLHSTAESSDTAKCELCTCPWNDHRQPETPWRNNLVKFKANKFTHHCQFPIHHLVCICLSSTACLFDVYIFFFIFHIQLCLGIPRGLPYFPSSAYCKVLFDWFSAISSYKSTISIMLGLLRWCPPLLSTVSQLWDGWMKEGLKGEGKKK